LRDQPEGARRFRVSAGAPADGRSVSELHLADGLWISLVVRDGRAIPVRPDTALAAGDEVLLITEPDADDGIDAVFTASARPPPEDHPASPA
jgi:cell volume regulation protein A